MLIRAAMLAAFLVAGGLPLPAAAADLVAEARQAYNAGDLSLAVNTARRAVEEGASVEEARIVLGRALVERYRRSARAEDLAEARQALITAASPDLAPPLRIEWLVGAAETMFFEEQYGAAAELFASVVDDPRAILAVPGGRERLLDWWATSADRAARKLDGSARDAAYRAMENRLRIELNRDGTLGAASYWLVIAARGAGDLDGAWYAAQAAWARAALAADHGAALRADIERAVSQALIPERSRRAGAGQLREAEVLRQEWESFKERWSSR
jgi:hypothetical protein